MLNTADHQRNANQNHNESSPHTSENGRPQSLEMTNIRENVDKREPLYTLVGILCSHDEKQYGDSSKSHEGKQYGDSSKNSIMAAYYLTYGN